MTFQKPYQDPDEELRATLRRGRSKMGDQPSPVTLRGVLVTIAWAAILAAIGFVLVGSGLIDPDFCRTANPLSC